MCDPNGCQKLRFYKTDLGKVCLAKDEACPDGETCECDVRRVEDSGECLCDASRGYYFDGTTCSSCGDGFLTEDGTQCVKSCEMYREIGDARQCCSSDDATCVCADGKMNVGGVCECPELSGENSDECVTKSDCLSEKLSIIGSRCLKGDCSTNLREPSCTSPSGFVQCGSG